MFESPINAVIGIDTDAETFSFYVDLGDRREAQQVVSYRCRPFCEEFYQKLDKAIKNYQQRNPSVSLAKVAIVLSDDAFLMDTLNVPTMNRRAMENSLEVAVGANYKGKKNLRYHTYSLSQNKQFSTFGIVGIRNDIVSKLHEVCAANQVSVQTVTSAANAMASGAMALNGRLRNGTYLLLDIKENCCRYAFVNKGRVIGAYRLPFGEAMLYKSRLVSEDLLFDHSSGELLVLNANEKAKAKQITMMGEEILTDPDMMPAETDEEEDEEAIFAAAAGSGKRTGRKLPKFMQRELPADREGFVYENFRIILKWTLDLLSGNPAITSQGAVDMVYVNMSKEYDYLFPRLNSEEEGNSVKFVPLLAGSGYSDQAADASVLELYGGFQLRQFGKINNF
ncbi:MAG: hypothetical protein E7453_03770 [Ruminococcaceae bacterium]|nr:hypothetical protein [Oscillospiraceae bacterium]